MLAKCAIAALAMAVGAALLTGAGDPLPRAEQTFLEARSMARLVAVNNGPATMRIERGRLVVRDGHANAIIEREWPSAVRAAALNQAVHIDRLGTLEIDAITLIYGERRLEIKP
jgi:hypothetical protein